VRHDTQRFATHYLAHHSGVLYQIVDGYASTEIALNCGTMLRECVKVSELLHVLLYGTVSAAGARARTQTVRAALGGAASPSFPAAAAAAPSLLLRLRAGWRPLQAHLRPLRVPRQQPQL